MVFSAYCASKKTGVDAHVNAGQTCWPVFNLSICEAETGSPEQAG